jgi:hypothetical protein
LGNARPLAFAEKRTEKLLRINKLAVRQASGLCRKKNGKVAENKRTCGARL